MNNIIEISARLRTSHEELKRSLALLPNLQFLKNNSTIAYNISENLNNKKIITAEIMFTDQSIKIIHNNTNITGISKTLLLLKFLAILAYVRQYYDIDLFLLYQNIIEAFQSVIFFEKQLNSNLKIERLKKQVDTLNLSNAILSQNIDLIKKMNLDNDSSIKLYKEFFVKVSESVKINLNTNPTQLNESLSPLGITIDLYKKLAALSYESDGDKK